MCALVRENIEMLRHYQSVGLGSLGADLIMKAPPAHEVLWLWFKNLLFTLLVPGLSSAGAPLRLVLSAGRSGQKCWGGATCGRRAVAVGAVIYLHCLWLFATRGQGTPARSTRQKKLVWRGLYKGSVTRCIWASSPGRGGPVPPLRSHRGLPDLPRLHRAAVVVGYEEGALRREIRRLYEATGATSRAGCRAKPKAPLEPCAGPAPGAELVAS